MSANVEQTRKVSGQFRPVVPWWAGLGLVVSVAAAGLLVLDHFFAAGIPGCGPGGGCARAAASRWGSIPGVEWPVGFLGLAFYVGLAGAWLALGRRADRASLALTRIGAIGAGGFLLLMLYERIGCPYCVAAHAGLLLFWIGVERSQMVTAPLCWRGLLTFATCAVGVTLLLIPFELNARDVQRERAEIALRESTAEIVATSADESRLQEGLAEAPTQGSRVGVLPSRLATGGEGGQPARARGESGSAPMQTVTRGADGQENAGFTGRYRLGPERAAIRLVIFSDYQCVDCRRIEAEARRIVESRSDASLSAKHFPMCGDCNPHMPHNMHPNACWAARAAEAAGMLAGAEGFWRMDRWLFERGGAFTDAELGAALPALGFNAGAFIQTMTGEETLRRVRADIEEAVALGLHFTPMIFINGVELRGWNAPDALARAVDAVVAADPPIRTAAADRPAPALEKYVDDWRAQPVRRMNDSIDWSIGAEGPAIQIVLFGDYTHDLSAQADELLRAMIRAAPALPDAAGGDVSSGNVPAAPRIRYHFRHFPFDARCNPMARQPSAQPFACRAAAAAEAAGRLAGPDGYWRMHEMLMQNHANLNSDDVLRNLAAAAELDPVALFDLIDSAEIDAAIAEDVRDAQRLGVQGIPTLFVNGRLVPRWRREGDDVLPRILAAAEPE